MNRFVIVDDLPYLFAGGKTYAVRWDAEGFTVGTEVKLAFVPTITHGEIAVKAQCPILDSIGEKKKAGRKKTAKAVDENDSDG